MNVQTVIVFVAICISVFSTIHLLRYKSRHDRLTDLLLDNIEKDAELRKTLAMGLYMRFKKEGDPEESKEAISELFIKQDPISFEHFVADIVERKFGGDIYVSPPSGDYGVDIENRRNDGQYFIQVKCYKKDLDYISIALLHSNMVKYNAVGGYVVTTSDFTGNAKTYAKDLGIELINGEQLVDMWIETLDKEKEYVSGLFPANN